MNYHTLVAVAVLAIITSCSGGNEPGPAVGSPKEAEEAPRVSASDGANMDAFYDEWRGSLVGTWKAFKRYPAPNEGSPYLLTDNYYLILHADGSLEDSYEGIRLGRWNLSVAKARKTGEYVPTLGLATQRVIQMGDELDTVIVNYLMRVPEFREEAGIDQLLIVDPIKQGGIAYIRQ